MLEILSLLRMPGMQCRAQSEESPNSKEALKKEAGSDELLAQGRQDL